MEVATPLATTGASKILLATKIRFVIDYFVDLVRTCRLSFINISGFGRVAIWQLTTLS